MGIVTAVGAGVLSVPLVFEYNLVLLFNDLFVTTGESPPISLPFFLAVLNGATYRT